MTRPSVSVVVPCYNAEKTVAETIESALSQGAGVEVIAIDDGSKDNTAAILRGFGDRIRADFGPNRGVSAARNSGISLAEGEWVQFLDSDDILMPDTLTTRLSEVGEADIIICDWKEFIDNGSVLTDGDLRRVDAEALAVNAELATASSVWAPPAAVLYRKSLVDRLNGFSVDLPVIQDARFLFDAARAGGRFTCSRHLGARYRVLRESLSRRKPQVFWDDVLTNGLQIEALWRSDGPLDAQRTRILAGIFSMAARNLLACQGPGYFKAVEGQRRLEQISWHSRISQPLARTLGLKRAYALLALTGRA